MNLALNNPELYDAVSDADESYDAAAEHPGVVSDMRRRIDSVMAGMPEGFREAWQDTGARKSSVPPAGALPRPVQ